MRVILYWVLGVGLAASGITFALIARQLMPTYKSIALGVVIVLIGLGFIDRATYYQMPVEKPQFTYVQGATSGPTYVVFDGFVGHPQKRFARLMSVFNDHSVLFVNPSGNRYDLEQVVQETAKYLRHRLIRVIIPVGMSLGAKAAYRLVQQWSARDVVRLDFIDPLFDGNGVRSPMAGPISWLRPGKILNWALSGTVAKIITGNPKHPNEHQKYGLGVQLSRVSDEARASLAPEIEGAINPGIPVMIFHCSDDDVLREQWLVWRDTLLEMEVEVTTIELPAGTTHVGFDQENQRTRWFMDLVSNL